MLQKCEDEFFAQKLCYEIVNKAVLCTCGKYGITTVVTSVSGVFER